MRWKMVLPAGLALAVATGASANDSTGFMATGGLVLTKSADVQMRSEDLYISEGQVRVTYGFLDTAAKDVTATVAFPLPDITVDEIGDVPNIPNRNSANFVNFVTLVDGKPVKTEVEQKAVLNGVDYTATLRKDGVPLAPEVDATSAALLELPKAAQEQLVKLGLVSEGTLDEGQGPKRVLNPRWTLKTTFYWTQTFPAGRVLKVEHRYAPSVGGFVDTYLGVDAARRKQEIATYCIDDALTSSLKAAESGADGPRYTSEYIRYVLTTGANWKGPIGDFTMTIDKGKAANMVSFCGDGVRKVGPTTFQVRYANYTPTRDVAVLILLRR